MPYQHINNKKLYYEWHGEENAYPLILINGLLADTAGWVYQIPTFAKHFRILVYDCCGQGRSDIPTGPYTTEAHVQDLRALLESLAIPHAHMVGLSNGGAIAILFAANYPEQVNRLILANTYTHSDAVMQAKLQSWLLGLDMGGLGERFDIAVPWVWGKTFLETHGHILAPVREKATQANREAVKALMQGAMTYDGRSYLERIQSATLVIAGEEDLLTPPSYARCIAQTIARSQFIILPQAGHALPIEKANLFNALVLAFLQEEDV